MPYANIAILKNLVMTKSDILEGIPIGLFLEHYMGLKYNHSINIFIQIDFNKPLSKIYEVNSL